MPDDDPMPGVAGGVVFVVVVLELMNEHFDISLVSSKSISTVGRVTVIVVGGTPIPFFCTIPITKSNPDTLPERLGIVVVTFVKSPILTLALYRHQN